MLVELSVVEQRYQAVLAVIRDGVPVVEVASRSLKGARTSFRVKLSGGKRTVSDGPFGRRSSSGPNEKAARWIHAVRTVPSRSPVGASDLSGILLGASHVAQDECASHNNDSENEDHDDRGDLPTHVVFVGTRGARVES